MSRRLFLFLLVMVVAWPTQSAIAQSGGVTLVYGDLNNAIRLYHSATETTTTLIEPVTGIRYEYDFLLSPSGDHVAIYSYSFDSQAFRAGDFSTAQYLLRVFALPSGELQLERNLLPPTYVFPSASGETEPGTQTAELPDAVGEFSWSPDGRYLAFVEGVTNGDGRVYAFDSRTGAINALPDDPGYPAALHWSPNGERIAYLGVDSFQNPDGSWLTNGLHVTAVGSSSMTIPLDTNAAWFIDWASDDALLWSPFNVEAGASGIFLHDVETDTNTAILEPGQVHSIPAWDVATQQLGFAVPDLTPEEGAPAQDGLAPGAYVIQDLTGEPQRVYEANNLYGVNFTAPDLLAVGNDLVYRLSDSREIALQELRRPLYSPDGLLALGERESRTLLRDLLTEEEDIVDPLYFVDGQWFNNTTFIAKIGAYGSVIGWGTIDGQFTQLVRDAGNMPFVGVIE